MTEKMILELIEKRNFKESEFRIAYYNQYVHSVEELECSQKEKEEIISSLPYLKEIAEPELYEMVLGAL